MLENVFKISKFELKRSTNAYDRRLLLFFLPTLALLLIFFFLFLKGGHLFENKFYTASSEDTVIVPLLDYNGKFVLREGSNTDVWTRTNAGVLIRRGYSFRSMAASASLIKSIKSYDRNVYSNYPADLAYPIWIKTAFVRKDNSSASTGFISFSNLTDEIIQTTDAASGQALGDGAGSGAQETGLRPGDSSVTKAPKNIVIDDSGFQTADNNRSDVEPNAEGYVTPSQLSPAIPFEPVYMALSIIVILTFITLLFSNRVYDEKVNKKGSLLMIAPLKTWEIIVGKTLPHFVMAIVISMIIAVLKTQDIVSLLLILVMLSAITLVYFSVAFVVALLSRSFKELSFMGIFYVSIYSLFLLIPAFLIGYSEASFASPLTVIVKLLLNEQVGLDLYAFTIVPQVLLGLLLFYIGGLIFTSEDLFSYKSIVSKILDAHENFLKKPYYLIFSSMGAVPFVFIIEMMMVVLLVSIRSGYSLTIVLVFAALVEELFKSIGIYTVHSRKLFRTSFKDSLLFGVYTGLGFFLAEKLMLVIVIAAFIKEYSVIVFAGLLLPLVLHTFFSVLFSLGLRRFGPRSVILLLPFISILHFSVNYFLSSLLIGGAI
jgi:ABC-type Na+ efflux pump permease subunit